MKDEKHDEENSTSGYALPPMTRSELFISPEQAHHREADGNTPTRVLSSHSLVGEDFILSARPSLDFPGDIALSPFTPSEGTRTPPISLPDPVTPLPLQPLPSLPSPTSPLNRASRLQPPIQSSATTSSLPGRMRPPRVPQVSLQPTRGPNTRHGRGLSNSDYSFLSALTDGTNDVHNQVATQTTGVISAIAVPRRRTVSWDFNDTSDRATNLGTTDGSIRSTPASILQPILREEIQALPASILTDLAPISPPSLLVQTSIPGDSNKFTPAPPSDSRQAKEQHVGPVWNPTSAQDTGSLIHALDQSESPCTPSSRRRKSDPRRIDKSGNTAMQYSVQEVMRTYPPEPIEETMLLSRIDTQTFSGNHESLVPEIPSDALRQFINYNSEEYLASASNEQGSTRISKHQNFNSEDNSFEGITKKLLDASPRRQRSSKAVSVAQNQREGAEHKRHAGDKMYEAAEAIFGQYADSILEKGNDEEAPGKRPEEPDRDPGRNTRANREVYPLQALTKKARDDWSYFVEFLGPHRPSLLKEFLRLTRMIMIPSLLIAALLFYVFENPPTGYFDPSTNEPDNVTIGLTGNKNPASVSWWILFCGVRQLITLELARFSQLIIIDFFTLRTRPFPKILGPTLSLMVAQAKGWPFILTFWALWDFALLYGENKFVHHWGFWQDWIALFNETNPHGSVTSGDTYSRILVLAVVVGVAISAKRAIMGQIVGKRVVRNYREDMARLMQKLIIMNDVAQLSVKMDSTAKSQALHHHEPHEGGGSTAWKTGVDGNLLASGVTQSGDSFDYSDGFSAHSRGDSKGLTASAQLEILDLLEAWEEPELQASVEEQITVGTILQFRRALTFVSDEYPFSPAFGSVRTREDCVKSAQVVFDRLTGGATLSFEVLCLVAKDSEGNIDRNAVRELIRVFRPNRNGELSKLDFVKSVDSVFKSLRLLLASIQNSQQIDKAYEAIVNVFFYVCAAFVVMAVLGVNLEALIIGLGSVLVSIAFMIGPTSSNYLEGILFVLARKPYDIGDMVNIDDVVAQSNTFGGESCWVIEKVDLFTTTARLAATRELATFSNGSLSMMRIKNLNRSDKPNVFLNLKFSLDTTLQQRQLFKRRMTAFVKERPREWIRLVDFRSTRVETDLGFVEYVLILQHREKWQNLGAVLTSRGEIFNYAVELQKALNMKYRAPRVPIDIRRVETESSGQSPNGSAEMDYLDEPKKER